MTSLLARLANLSHKARARTVTKDYSRRFDGLDSNLLTRRGGASAARNLSRAGNNNWEAVITRAPAAGRRRKQQDELLSSLLASPLAPRLAVREFRRQYSLLATGTKEEAPGRRGG